MSYTTRTALEARFGSAEMADLEYGKPGAIEEAITGADALIDSYIGARYSLPLATVPVVLEQVARDLVRYSLDNEPTDTIKERHKQAVAYLVEVSKGRASLGVPQAEEPASIGTAEIQSGGSVWKRETSTGFI